MSFGTATEPATFAGDYDVYVFDRASGGRTKLLGSAGTAEVDAVAVYARVSRGIFTDGGRAERLHDRFTTARPRRTSTSSTCRRCSLDPLSEHPHGARVEDFSQFDLYEDLPPLATETSIASANPSNVASDEFGKVYVRRRLMGHVPLQPDGSTHFVTYGGLPLVDRSPRDDALDKDKLPRFQREEIGFAPGEYAHQGFQRQFFNNMCGFCHGSVSGRPFDNAVAPDILTQASNTASHGETPIELRVPASQRGAATDPPANP